MIKKKRLSPFGLDFWIEKGYTKEDAEYKRNSIRPIRKEYWLEKVISLEESISKAKETKEENNKKGSKKANSRSKEEKRKTSNKCVEYWIERGLSLEEAKQEISKIQRTFSIETCIEKYGYETGVKKWKERQEKWQKTLASKSTSEKMKINQSKKSFSLSKFDNITECILVLNEKRNMKLVDNEKDFLSLLEEKIENNINLLYWDIDYFLEKHIPKIQIEIFKHLGIDTRNILKSFLRPNGIFLEKRGNKQAYRKSVKEGLLRSSFEIYFYDQYRAKFPDSVVLLDNNYPNSSFRYDFLINNTLYIEICPMIKTNEKYKSKMLKKQEIFDCILLSSKKEIDDFINSL